ncbi:MAG: DNA-directed RNA polymerase subunit H [Candidatus Heimdallarchaeaceae archaeon]
MVTKDQAAKEERVKKGVEEILAFRGYEITDIKTDEDQIDFFASKTDEDGEELNLIARYPRKASVGVKTIRDLDKYRKEEDIQDAIIIAEGTLTHYARKECLQRGVEIISGSNPLFNIFDHDIVPLHIKLEEDEVLSVLERYQIKKHQLPKIMDTDPAIKAIQAQPGDVIKIIRNPDMGEAGLYYRYVIRSSSRLRLSKKKKPNTILEDDEEEEEIDEEE